MLSHRGVFMPKASKISLFRQAFLWHTIGGRVESEKKMLTHIGKLGKKIVSENLVKEKSYE